MARPSIKFVGTPSIFESLILKQIDLHCKNIILHIFYDIIFWAIGINFTWQCHHNCFNSKLNFCPHRHFLWECFRLPILCLLVFCLCEVSHKCTRGISRYLGISTKGVKLCMNWRQDLIQICFWMLPKSFYNSFVLQMILIHCKTNLSVYYKNPSTFCVHWELLSCLT